MRCMLALVKEASLDHHGAAVGSFLGLDAICHLAKTGSMAERRQILDQLLDNNLVEVLLSVRSHPPCARCVAHW